MQLNSDGYLYISLERKTYNFPVYQVVKRFIDILLASIAMIILLPVFIPCIIILKLTGEHEVFYFQKRMGHKNQIFNIWKFATMLKNSLNIGTGVITVRNDPRVTRFGKILRITKINELPQLINILKGDMSIVGPRPLIQASINLYPEEIRDEIYNCKPGMTGIGSLIFRDEEKMVTDSPDPKAMYEIIFPYKGMLEIWYQKNASLYTDFMIIFLTGWSIIFPKNQLVTKVFKDLPARPF